MAVTCGSLDKTWDEERSVSGGSISKSVLLDDSYNQYLCRHAMLVNQRTEDIVVPLNAQLGCEGKLELANSKSTYESKYDALDVDCMCTRLAQ